MIPKIIHQIWIQGIDQMPADLKEQHNNCKVINSEFKYYFWDEIKIRKLLNKEFPDEYLALYDSLILPAQKSDLARYVILYMYGGIYLDMDMVCRKNLEDFLKFKLFFTTDIFNNLYKRYLIGIIGSTKKHPIFKIIFKKILERKDYANDFVPYSTGTQLFYDSVEEYRKETNDKNISIIDRKYLHPCTILDDELCPYTCEQCYVAHVNYSSWSPSLRIFKFIVKNFKLILLILIILIIIFLFKNKFIGS